MPPIENRGYLLHLTHYDPVHIAVKDKEESFCLSTAQKIIDAVSDAGFNIILIGISDGIIYKSHPEFRRHYSRPNEDLAELCSYARTKGLETAPKLNFSQSEINCHNNWMRAPDEEWHTHFDDDYYWQTASECIDEVISLCSPERFFHIGMDEDHNRSYSQFVSAVRKLNKIVCKHGLQPLSWSDSGLDYASGDIYMEKSRLAEKEIKDSMIRLLWNYWAVPEQAARNIIENGHELWCAPGNSDPKQICEFRDLGKDIGATGIVMTNWKIANATNEKTIIERIREVGPLFNQ